jgi:hypothetical protein
MGRKLHCIQERGKENVTSSKKEAIQKEKAAVVFTRAKTLSSWVTRYFTKEKWSHTGVLIQGKVYHSTLGTGCHVSSLKDFLEDTEFLYFSFELDFPKQGELSAQEERAVECLGKGYDVALLPEIATHTRDKEDFEDQQEAEEKMVCSEYSEYILFGTGHSLTPGELLAIVQKSSS